MNILDFHIAYLAIKQDDLEKKIIVQFLKPKIVHFFICMVSNLCYCESPLPTAMRKGAFV